MHNNNNNNNNNGRNITDVSDLMCTTKSKMYPLIPPYPSECCHTFKPYNVHVCRCCNYAHFGGLNPLYFNFFWPLKNALHKFSFQSGAGAEHHSCVPADYEINRKHPAPGTLRGDTSYCLVLLCDMAKYEITAATR